MTRFKKLLLSLCLIVPLATYVATPNTAYGAPKERTMQWDSVSGHNHDGATKGKKINAGDVVNIPAGGISAIDVQTAIDELDTEKISETDKGVANGVATLDGSTKIYAVQLPAIAITDVNVCANESCQTNLVAEEGDVCIRSDENKSYIHNGGIVGDMTDWNVLLSTGLVTSVNGGIGDIVNVEKTTRLQTTISDSDTNYPSSGAVVDYVAAGISPDSIAVGSGTDKFYSGTDSNGDVYWSFNCTESAGTWTANDNSKDAYAFIYDDGTGLLVKTKNDTSSPWLTANFDSSGSWNTSGTFTSAYGLVGQRAGSGLNVFTGQDTTAGTPTMIVLDTTPALRMSDGTGATDTFLIRTGAAELTLTNDLIINDDLVVNDIANLGATSGMDMAVGSDTENAGVNYLGYLGYNCYRDNAADQWEAYDTSKSAGILFYDDTDSRFQLYRKNDTSSPWIDGNWDSSTVLLDWGDGNKFKPTAIQVQGASGDEEFLLLQNGDSQARFVIKGDSSCNWGSGSAATDNSLTRVDATTMAFSDDLTVTGGNINIGNDVNIYDGGTNLLQTDDAFTTGGVITSGSDFRTTRSTDTDSALAFQVSGDSTYRHVTLADGKHEWGSGSAARDTNLYRSAANLLKTDDSFESVGTVTAGSTISTTSETAFKITGTDDGAFFKQDATTTDGNFIFSDITAESFARFLIRNDGQVQWGGGAGGRDVILERSEANTLKLGSGDSLDMDDPTKLTYSTYTRRKSVGAGAFRPLDTSDQPTATFDGNYDDYIVSSPADSTLRYAVFGVNLPNGAVVTRIDSYGYTAAGGSNQVNLVLYRTSISSNSPSSMASCTFSSGGSSANQTTISNATVSSAYTYKLVVGISSATSTQNAQFYNCSIDFTTTNMGMTQ